MTILFQLDQSKIENRLSPNAGKSKIENPLAEVELSLLLEGIYQYYGYDFRDYAPGSLRRRVNHCMIAEGVATISALQERVLHHRESFERFLVNFSVNVTAMFRDPPFYRQFRDEIVPLLRSLPLIRFWSAGCSTGEEVYSLAILLEEVGLYERSQIFATDLNGEVLQQARRGAFPLAYMRDYTSNYLQAGGSHFFSNYYTAAYDEVSLNPALAKNVTFAQHNLVSDSSFNQFQVIWCRNVTIYFNKKLQDRVHRLFYESLLPGGILGLGSKETLSGTPYENCYEPLGSVGLYRKIG